MNHISETLTEIAKTAVIGLQSEGEDAKQHYLEEILGLLGVGTGAVNYEPGKQPYPRQIVPDALIERFEHVFGVIRYDNDED